MLVKEWMTSDVVIIDEDTSMMKAFQIMKENSIRRLTVMRQGKLIGIVTEKEVADMIREHGGQMVSILTSYDKGEENCRNVYIRIKELPEDKIKSLTQELDKNFILLYLVKDSLKDV